MLARFFERRGLPKVAEEFAGAPVRQFWDDRRAVGREFKERIIPGFHREVAWDVWVLFDEQATWDSAGEHVVDWGSTVEATEEELFAHLDGLSKK
jgi:hypothetical protein